MNLLDTYKVRYERILLPLAPYLETHIKDRFAGQPRIDRINVRAKSIERFLEKAVKTISDGTAKYSDPINQIQDQLGARIVTYYIDDVERISAIVNRYFREIEARLVIPDSEYEFSYFGKHYVLIIPPEVFPDGHKPDDCPSFFELQIHTLFQHAWSEANHDFGYKPEVELSPEDKRRLAFTAAQAWGADMIFSELFQKLTLDKS